MLPKSSPQRLNPKFINATGYGNFGKELGVLVKSVFFQLWFQQDGSTCHTARATIDLLKGTLGDRLISRFGPVNWPPRSCDLTPLDYFLWDYVKSLVYANKLRTLDHLEDNIRRVIADIRSQMLEKVIENWTSRLDYIRASRGNHMPEIIVKIREIAKDIQSHSRTQWEKHIEALSPVDNTLWRKSSLLHSLQEQFEPNHVVGREDFAQRIHTEVEKFLATPLVQEIESTTPTEVLTYVQRIKPRKSPRLDQITKRMLKNLPLKFLLFITLLINQLFRNNYFPDSWKIAVVIPILKPDKNPEIAQNYRPISLLSSLSKVYEFVLLRRLNQHCAASNMIIPQQCGFRPHCSTVHQLLRVTELIHSGFENHDATGILFLDIAKAFDKIRHDGLLIKLIRFDFPAPLIKFIHSFLSHRSFRVRVDRILSSPRPIRSGLPQGSLSSPLLFTLYVNDIPQTALSHLAMFADDTAIITQNKRFSVVISNMQHYISLLELWLNDWKIKVNASKSACLMFTRKNQLLVGLTPVTIFGQPVPWVNVAKYVGLFLDAKLTFARHVEQTRKKATAVHSMLKKLISRRSKLAIRHKVLLFNSIIRPVMCYGSQIFGSAGMCHLKKLHTLTNSFLRQIVNASWFVRNEVIYRDLKIKPFLPYIKNLSKRFFDNLPNIPNELIRIQPAYNPAVPSSQKRPRVLLDHEFIKFPKPKGLGLSSTFFIGNLKLILT
ncbi:RNA-directed DNA polymerase from mobile element jockey [Trichonephila clavipes]|nr:RNA-directed DNA polymerase from mobile element jockey [Trichonephila clavipes]